MNIGGWGVRSHWNGEPPTGKSVSVSCSCRACVRSCVCVIERESRANSSREFRGVCVWGCPTHAGSVPGLCGQCWVGARSIWTMLGRCPVHVGSCILFLVVFVLLLFFVCFLCCGILLCVFVVFLFLCMPVLFCVFCVIGSVY